METSSEQEVEVIVRSYHGKDWQSYTYMADESAAVSLQLGSLVVVPFGKRHSIGIVCSRPKQLSKPTNYTVQPLAQIIHSQPLPATLVALAKWLQQFYAAPLDQVLTTMLPTSLERNGRLRFEPNTVGSTTLPQLSPEQTVALQCITDSPANKVLLHGVTGSGKTMVYAHLCQQVMATGNSALLLVPEIVLTHQLVAQFEQLLPNVVVLHSTLTPAQRLARWRYILEQSPHTPLMIIGTRSALFAPTAKLGAIIVDECHEGSYKQDSGLRYNAVDVAAKLSSLHSAHLVLGSATPSAVQYSLAEQGKLQLVTLQERYGTGVELPNVTITKPERDELFGSELRLALQQTLERGQQTILLHNRRGSAQAGLCSNCGWLARCPNCEVGLVYHADRNSLNCHYCSYTTTPPASCPECGQATIRFVGFGTKQIETELQQLLPSARVARLDSDVHAKDVPTILQTMHDGKIDVLIGTQMISRGLDFGKVALVAVILAETSLAIPDFAAGERAFQLFTQAAGRAGRRSELGQVIIQAYNPEQPILRFVSNHNYQGYIESELQLRRQYLYPPYHYLVQLWCAYADAKRGQRELESLKQQLEQSSSAIKVVGPVPSHPFRRGNRYQWQLIVKARARKALTELCSTLPPTVYHNLDPIDLM